MKQIRFGKKLKLLWGLILAAAWICVGMLLYKMHGGFTAQELVNYQPDSPFLSGLIMLGLFFLKSVDFLMHSGVLYAANGIMFPLPLALLLNLTGIVIVFMPAYFAGRAFGPSILQTLTDKYPKLRAIARQQEKDELVFAVLMRSVGLPLHIASLYMGAAQFDFKRYIAGSVLGILPLMIPYTVMGESANNIHSPAFWISLGVEILVTVISIVIYRIMKKKEHIKSVD